MPERCSKVAQKFCTVPRIFLRQHVLNFNIFHTRFQTRSLKLIPACPYPFSGPSLCTDVPPPLEKDRFFSRFFSEGGGTSVLQAEITSSFLSHSIRKSSLRTADAFPVVAFLPLKNSCYK